MSDEARSYIRFFHEHGEVLRDTSTVADVAVLRSFPSVMFNPGQCLTSTVLFEQLLLQSRIPFDIIFDGHVRNLSRYKVLVLANQDALSDGQISDIRAFVKDGGGLVATENSSMLNEWRLRRGRFALADVFGIEAPAKPDTPNVPLRRSFGTGRVVYVPRVEPSTEPPRPRMTYTINGTFWTLPKNTRDLLAAVRWAAGGRFTVEVEAPPSVTCELVEQKRSKTWLLHLVNFDFRKPVSNLNVRLRIPAGQSVAEVVVETPDGPDRKVLDRQSRPDSVSFRLPQLRVYDLVRIRFAGAVR